jgi:hypothetical protein
MKKVNMERLRTSVSGMKSAPAAPSPLSVPLVIDSDHDSTSAQPVTVGIPFPRGAVTHVGRLIWLDAAGRQIPLQTCPLAWWPDGSLQWLLLDFVLDNVKKGTTLCRLAESGNEEPHSRASMGIQESSTGITIHTGAISARFSPDSGPLPARVSSPAAELIEPGSSRLLLTDSRERPIAPEVHEFAMEARGPIRATVRCAGSFPGPRPLDFVARLCFFAGSSLARLRLTVRNPDRARHRGGLWDLGDKGSCLFRSLSLLMRLAGSSASRVFWSAEAGQPPEARRAGRLEIYQGSSGGPNWQSANHIDRRGKIPCSFRGFRVRCDGRENFGRRASPEITAEGPAGSVTVAVPEFWQQFPKAIEIDGQNLRIGLFPEEWGELYELQGGEQKTHTLWLNFAAADAPPPSLRWAYHPVRVRSTPEWYQDTGAILHLAPARQDDDPRLDQFLGEVATGEKSLTARREAIDEYGWRNYGEIYADHEAVYYSGPPPLISHYNNQYDMVYGAILQYLRTGDPAWAAIFDPLARHVIDIDIYHTDEDRSAYNGGLFWPTDHYKTAATATHRTYSRANRGPNGRSYGGGPCNEHNYTTGLLHYYFLTGNPDAHDAVLRLADWVHRMDDGRQNLLGILDPGPTGLASATVDPGYHGPGRGCGNSINALLDAWLLTACRRHLDKAEELIRRSVHPRDDVARHDLLNVEKRWSYTVFLTALARYLHLKAAADELDSMYAYARAGLLRYAAWMLDHETPYFDHPEKLEYPTETWAAQEFRKANVMRLAAAYAQEPFRAKLVRRGDELAERAWTDLLRFATRTVARAAAIVMVEGPRDAFFRRHGIPSLPRSLENHKFGPPEEFVPQRLRVLRRLKSPRGLAHSLLRLIDPGRRHRQGSTTKT